MVCEERRAGSSRGREAFVGKLASVEILFSTEVKCEKKKSKIDRNVARALRSCSFAKVAWLPLFSESLVSLFGAICHVLLFHACMVSAQFHLGYYCVNTFRCTSIFIFTAQLFAVLA